MILLDATDLPMRRNALAAVGLALCAALFFTMTYVLNRSLVTGGGHWAWAVILRYLITLPLLALALPWRGGLGELPRELRAHPRAWTVAGADVRAVPCRVPLARAAELAGAHGVVARADARHPVPRDRAPRRSGGCR